MRSSLRVPTAIGLCAVLVIAGRGIWAYQSAKKLAHQRQIQTINGVSVDYILTPERIDLLGNLIGSEFDVAPDGTVFIGNTEGLLAITGVDDGIVVDKLMDESPESFAVDGAGAILSIANQYFGQLEDGKFSRLVPLPYKRMRLMPSSLSGVVYLLGGQNETERRAYIFADDGTLRILAEIPEEIVAICDNQNSVYVASRHNIFRINSGDVQVVMRLPKTLGEVASLAVAPDDKSIFFSTNRETFIISGLAAVAVARDLGGIVRHRNNRLYIWSPERGMLITLSGIQEILENARR